MPCCLREIGWNMCGLNILDGGGLIDAGGRSRSLLTSRLREAQGVPRDPGCASTHTGNAGTGRGTFCRPQ
jgi:hypothetical protein